MGRAIRYVRGGTSCARVSNALTVGVGKRAGVDERLPNLRADIKGHRRVLEPGRTRDFARRNGIRSSWCLRSPSDSFETKATATGSCPSNETIRRLMHELGFRPRKVQKAKPKKNFRKPMLSSAGSTKSER